MLGHVHYLYAYINMYVCICEYNILYIYTYIRKYIYIYMYVFAEDTNVGSVILCSHLVIPDYPQLPHRNENNTNG